MQNYTKPVIIIPAYNEEYYIDKTLTLIQKTGLDVDIIVVNDGSTDRTSKIAELHGAKVVNMPINRGKSAAFFAGIKEALKQRPVSVVVLDADIMEISRFALARLVLAGKYDTLDRKFGMYVAKQIEHGTVCQRVFCGQRSFSLPFLYALLRSKFKRYAKGYSLEYFLDFFAKENGFANLDLDVEIHTDIQYRAHTNENLTHTIKRQIDDLGNFNSKRKVLNSKVHNIRKSRHFI